MQTNCCSRRPSSESDFQWPGPQRPVAEYLHRNAKCFRQITIQCPWSDQQLRQFDKSRIRRGTRCSVAGPLPLACGQPVNTIAAYGCTARAVGPETLPRAFCGRPEGHPARTHASPNLGCRWVQELKNKQSKDHGRRGRKQRCRPRTSVNSNATRRGKRVMKPAQFVSVIYFEMRTSSVGRIYGYTP